MTTAITTLGMRARAVKAPWRSAVRAEISANVRPSISLMSAPAAKTRSPPHSTTAPTRSSRLACLAASPSSCWTCALSAFTGGRSSRIVPTRLSSSTSRRTNSPIGGPSTRLGAEFYRDAQARRVSVRHGLLWATTGSARVSDRARRTDSVVLCQHRPQGARHVIKQSPVKGKEQVKVNFILPSDAVTGKVSVVGDFNDWDPFAHPLRPRSNGTRSVAVTLPAQRRFAFRYLDEAGRWHDDDATPGRLGPLLVLDLGRDAQDLQRLVVGGDVLVDPDDHLLALLELLLVAEGGVGHLLLEPALLDAGEHALQHAPLAEGVDALEDLLRPPLYQVGHVLDVPGAAERVDDAGDAGLLGDHLLGAHRDRRRPLGRQREHLVQRVGVQRLGAAEHGREGLQGGADDVVVRLLAGQRDPGGLGVEPELAGLVGAGAVALPQPARPDPAGRTEIADLLEEVDVRVEEERQLWPEHVDVEAAALSQLDVGESVGQGEGQLLGGC